MASLKLRGINPSTREEALSMMQDYWRCRMAIATAAMAIATVVMAATTAVVSIGAMSSIHGLNLLGVGDMPRQQWARWQY